jgi:hypothetical protein
VLPLLRLVGERPREELSAREVDVVLNLLRRAEQWASLASRRLSKPRGRASAANAERITDVQMTLNSVLVAIGRSRLPRLLAREAREFAIVEDFEHVCVLIEGVHTDAERAVVNDAIEPSFEDLLSEPKLLASDAREAKLMRPILRALDARRGDVQRNALVAAVEQLVAIRHRMTPAAVHEARVGSARVAAGKKRRRRGV